MNDRGVRQSGRGLTAVGGQKLIRQRSSGKRTLSKLLARRAEFTRTSGYVAVSALVDAAALIASSLISLRATNKLQWI